MSDSTALAKQVFYRDNSSCTSCGSWLDDAQPSSYTELMYPRSRRAQYMETPANYLTVCEGCRSMLDRAFRFYSGDPHDPQIRQTYRHAGFELGLRPESPEDVPVWIELQGGPIWFSLTADGRRVVTTKEQ